MSADEFQQQLEEMGLDGDWEAVVERFAAYHDDGENAGYSLVNAIEDYASAEADIEEMRQEFLQKKRKRLVEAAEGEVSFEGDSYVADAMVEIPSEAWADACEEWHYAREHGDEDADLMDFVQSRVVLDTTYTVAGSEDDVQGGGNNTTPSRDSGTVTVDVEVSEALVELIRREHGEDVDLSEWLAGAGEMRLREGYWHEDTTIPVDVPDELAERANLLAEHSRVQHGKTGLEGSRDDWLADLSHVEFRFPDETADNGGDSEE